MRVLITFFLFCTTLLNISLCQNNKDTIIEAYGFVNGIKIGNTKTEIKNMGYKPQRFLFSLIKYKMLKNKYGYPVRRKIVTKKSRTKKCWKTKIDGVYFYFDNNIVSAILITSKNYVTKSGIKIGDSFDRVCSVYGDNISYTSGFVVYLDRGILFTLNSSGFIEKIFIIQTDRVRIANNIIIQNFDLY